MRRRIIIIVTAAVFCLSAVFGMVKRTTYTDITAQDNYMDSLQTGVLPEEMAVSCCAALPDVLSQAPIVIKAKVTGGLEQLFYNTRQKIQVEKAFKGSEIQEGSEIYVFSTHGSLSLKVEPASIECGFVNIMDEGEEYLIFLSGRVLDSKEGIPMYEMYWGPIITPVFGYKDKEEKPVKYNAESEHTYVPYREVKENEFFCDSENGYKAWRELKEKMLQEYR